MTHPLKDKNFEEETRFLIVKSSKSEVAKLAHSATASKLQSKGRKNSVFFKN
jgi:hypothetical protein